MTASIRIQMSLLACLVLGCGSASKQNTDVKASPSQDAPPLIRGASEQGTSDTIAERKLQKETNEANEEPENAKAPVDDVLSCGDFKIENGTYLFSFTVDRFTQGAVVDLEVDDGGFVLSGGKLDPLRWEVKDTTASFEIDNDANVMAGTGTVTRDNVIEGTMTQGSVGGTFKLEMQSKQRLFKPQE